MGMHRQLVYGLFLFLNLTPYFFPRVHAIGFFLLLVSSLSTLFLLKLWERKMRESVAKIVQLKMHALTPPLPPTNETVQALHCEIDQKLEELRQSYLEYEDLRKNYALLEEELQSHREQSEELLNNKDTLLSEYHQTIQEQRGVIEKKQHTILKLEEKVHDLMYEIRSLLQLEQAPPPPLDALSLQKEELSSYYLLDPKH